MSVNRSMHREAVRWLAAGAFGAVIVGPAAATPVNVDATDIWYDPNESGWGMQLVNTDKFVFATLFIYGADGKPTWVTGELQKGETKVWTGPLYATSGTYYGSKWNPAELKVREAGSMTFDMPCCDDGTLVYTIDGVKVTKSVRRQTLTNDNYDATYVGTLAYSTYECANPSRNLTGNATGTVVITQREAAEASKVTFPLKDGGSCQIVSASYAQVGRLGKFWGYGTCTNGDSGPATVYQMSQDQYSRFMALAYVESNNDSKCKTFGQLVGVRSVN